ncbi:ABC transporter substrate-binding protein [Roseomonas sp. OT10]|uniref:ABC transporter substrate-binding protein n=1 Tax=Roseomonas cutis TaxID=2897332 RepID=UPI001E29E395|nr:ABC transporter substrate-binding protein [Roseomonas sp. OT10]UFN50261.1 ABC transporter substrate-binding protein [Roseomonas sp. OT10]
MTTPVCLGPSRRMLLGAVLAAPALAAPRLAASQGPRVLRFVPQADLAVLDPVFTTAAVTTCHANMVFDSLYGLDTAFRPQPQMVEGHTVEDDGLTWTMTLREGLRFHDGEPVRAKDAVASVRRWGARDMYGQEVIARSHEIAALDDRRLRFRLRQPFPNLPAALGKNGASICVVMPERLAATEPTKQVTEMVGSGPYRFLAEERMAGARAAYARFEGYLPRPGGAPDRLAGPKVAHFDRVEWSIIPDQATAAAALMAGEVDWLETTSNDLQPMLKRHRALTVRLCEDLFGCILRFNWLQPPFDKPAIRRALLGAISQEDFMSAAYGTDPAAWEIGVGFFTSDSPMASKAALEPLTGKRDLAKVRRDLAAAGYAGEKVVVLQADDYATLKGLAEVAGHTLREVGMNVEVQSGDWGTVSQRRGNKGPLDKGGWSVFVTSLSNTIDPGGHLGLRANGARAWFGWPDSPALESLRQDWIAAPDTAAQKRICEAMQIQAMQDVPYVPLGEYRTLTAYKNDLTGMPPGAPLFFGVRRG